MPQFADIVKLVKTAYLSMSNLIDKSALLAEIERLVNNYDKALDYEAALEDVRDFIDTLEVKEIQVKESAETQHINEPCKENGNSLTQEPVSEDVVSVAKQYIDSHVFGNEEDKFTRSVLVDMFCSGANWQKNHLWKSADGDDLPEIDREVIALLDNGKVVFAHRPPEYWDGKNIVTGKVTRNYPKTYDKGGWNIPDVKYWLDVELPKEIEL